MNDRFCVFDDYAVAANSLPPADHDLKRFLSYNPIYHTRLLKEPDLNVALPPDHEPSNQVAETDRTGWRYYDRVYSKYLSRYQEQKIDLLEIGIEYGYGLLAWSRYFPNSNIEGMELLDIFTSEYEVIKNNFPLESSRIKFNTKANSRSSESWQRLFGEKKFDIIIDDGGHSPQSQMETMVSAVSYLKDSSMYFIEDVKLNVTAQSDIEKFYDMLITLAKDNQLDMKVYKHVNPYRLDLLNMSKSEWIFHITEKILRENPGTKSRAAIVEAKRSVEADNGNYYNYMLAFTRGF